MPRKDQTALIDLLCKMSDRNLRVMLYWYARCQIAEARLALLSPKPQKNFQIPKIHP